MTTQTPTGTTYTATVAVPDPETGLTIFTVTAEGPTAAEALEAAATKAHAIGGGAVVVVGVNEVA